MLSCLKLRTNAWLRLACSHWQPTARFEIPVQHCRRPAKKHRACFKKSSRRGLSCTPALHASMPSVGESRAPISTFAWLREVCNVYITIISLAVWVGAGAHSRDSLVLGIESSCDDTGVAVVRASDGTILGQAVTGQVHSPATFTLT
jgi:hypothetical protein